MTQLSLIEPTPTQDEMQTRKNRWLIALRAEIMRRVASARYVARIARHSEAA